MKYNKHVYYGFTALVSLTSTMSGLMILSGSEQVMQGMNHVGMTNPVLLKYLGVAKLLGAIGLWVPRGKSWAYHGFTFLFCGAMCAHIGAGDGMKEIMAPFMSLVFMGVSYYFWMKSPECQNHHTKLKMAA
jgi:hypothetical protein